MAALGLAVSVRVGHEGARASDPVRKASELTHHSRTKRWISETVLLKGYMVFREDRFFCFNFRSSVNLHHTFHKDQSVVVHCCI